MKMSQKLDVFKHCTTRGKNEAVVQDLIGWSGRWSLLGGLVVCCSCFASQTPEDSQTPFVHLPCCIAISSGLYPWRELSDILSEVSPTQMRAGDEG